MRRMISTLALTALLSACGGNGTNPPYAVDARYAATFTLVSDTCQYGVPMPADGWLSSVDLYQRHDGTFDFRLDPLLPMPFITFRRIDIRLNGIVSYASGEDNSASGFTQPQRLDGLVTRDELDLTVTKSSANSTGLCQTVFALRGVPRNLRAADQLDGTYHATGFYTGYFCPNLARPDVSATFFPVDVMPLGGEGLRVSIGGAWFETTVAELAAGWHGTVLAPSDEGGETPFISTITGTLDPSGLALSLDIDASDGTPETAGCVDNYRVHGLRMLYDSASLENDYRAVVVSQPCDNSISKPVELPISLYLMDDGSYLLDENGNFTSLTRDANGTLGNALGGGAYTVLSESPFNYRVDYANGTCTDSYNITTTVRFSGP